jgi:hypothetical protein
MSRFTGFRCEVLGEAIQPSTIHFHPVWRGDLTQTSNFALLLGGILLITEFRNDTALYSWCPTCLSLYYQDAPSRP